MLQALSRVSNNPSLPALGIFLIMAKTQILAAVLDYTQNAQQSDVMPFVTIYC